MSHFSSLAIANHAFVLTTHTEVAEWRKQKILTPAKRGRKPGSGKKNIIKAATGKVVYVSVDISRFPNGTVLLQVSGPPVEATYLLGA